MPMEASPVALLEIIFRNMKKRLDRNTGLVILSL